MKNNIRLFLILLFFLVLSGCSFNPFSTQNNLTGSGAGTAIGAAAGVGGSALLGAKPPVVALAGLSGAAIGYYVTTLRFASGGIIQAGGQVFTLGEYATIEIPTDQLFDSNTSEFLEDAGPILNSAVAVLKRYPDHNIMISGNTSGFGATKFERRLSENRARQVASYLWAHGISEFKKQSNQTRHLSYVGYGNYFPIANNIHNDSIRQNSRIQITAYPSSAQLEITRGQTIFRNIGRFEPNFQPVRDGEYVGNLSETYLEESRAQRMDYKGELSEGATNYNSLANASHTFAGESVPKQGGFADAFKLSPDLKGELAG